MTTKQQTLGEALIAALGGKDAVLALLAEPAQASAPVKATRPRKAKVNKWYAEKIQARKACAYGVEACGRFAPNGVGSKQHTTCPKGLKALNAARA